MARSKNKRREGYKSPSPSWRFSKVHKATIDALKRRAATAVSSCAALLALSVGAQAQVPDNMTWANYLKDLNERSQAAAPEKPAIQNFRALLQLHVNDYVRDDSSFIEFGTARNFQISYVSERILQGVYGAERSQQNLWRLAVRAKSNPDENMVLLAPLYLDTMPLPSFGRDTKAKEAMGSIWGDARKWFGARGAQLNHLKEAGDRLTQIIIQSTSRVPVFDSWQRQQDVLDRFADWARSTVGQEKPAAQRLTEWQKFIQKWIDQSKTQTQARATTQRVFVYVA